MTHWLTPAQAWKLGLILMLLPALHPVLKREHGSAARGWGAFGVELAQMFLLLAVALAVMLTGIHFAVQRQWLAAGPAVEVGLGVLLLVFALTRPKLLWSDAAITRGLVQPTTAAILIGSLGIALIGLGVCSVDLFAWLDPAPRAISSIAGAA
jgi:hypothetical protein